MTNPSIAKPNAAKRIASSLFSRHFGSSKKFITSFRDDISAVSESAKSRRESSYAVHPDEDQRKWNQKKWFFLVEIQLYQIGFIGVIASAAINQSASLITLLFGFWCAGWYIAKIRDTYRARYVSAHWDKRNKPLSITWASFAQVVKRKPSILIPTWRVFK